MIRSLFATTAAAVADRKGVTAAEYAILAVAIVVAVGAAANAFAPLLLAKFNAIFGVVAATG